MILLVSSEQFEKFVRFAREKFYFFPSPASLLTIVIAFVIPVVVAVAAAAFELLVAKAATGDSSWANWNPIAVDFLRNSFLAWQKDCKLRTVFSGGGWGYYGLRTNESALCAQGAPIVCLPLPLLSPFFYPFASTLCARLMATC